MNKNRFKFRVWDSKREKFGNPDDYGLILGHGLIHGEVKHPVYGFYYNPDVVLQQFTGFKDMEGKEIYEGDILTFTTSFDYLTRIIWSEESGSFQTCSKDGGAFINEQYMLLFKVVGNIFENKELLDTLL